MARQSKKQTKTAEVILPVGLTTVVTCSPSIVKPLIRDRDKKHALEVMFEGKPERLPVLTSIGFAPIGPGNAWVNYVMKSRGKEIIEVEVSEPNLRQIAEDGAKVDFTLNFLDQEYKEI